VTAAAAAQVLVAVALGQPVAKELAVHLPQVAGNLLGEAAPRVAPLARLGALFRCTSLKRRAVPWWTSGRIFQSFLVGML